MRTIETIITDIELAIFEWDGVYHGDQPNARSLLRYDMGLVSSRINELEDKVERYEEFAKDFAMGHYLTELVDFNELDTEKLQPCEDYEGWNREDLLKAIRLMYKELMEFANEN